MHIHGSARGKKPAAEPRVGEGHARWPWLGLVGGKPGKQACARGSNRPTGRRLWLLDLATGLKIGLNCCGLGNCYGLSLGLKFGLKWALNLGSNGL